jgi:hypothetical protein
MTVARADFHIEGNFATAIYWIDVKGGVRWHYTDQCLVLYSFIDKNSISQYMILSDTMKILNGY